MPGPLWRQGGLFGDDEEEDEGPVGGGSSANASQARSALFGDGSDDGALCTPVRARAAAGVVTPLTVGLCCVVAEGDLFGGGGKKKGAAGLFGDSDDEAAE